LDNQITEFLKEQNANTIKEKQRWENLKSEKENDHNYKQKQIEDRMKNIKVKSEKFEKEYKAYLL
jgi:hypothetical protein